MKIKLIIWDLDDTLWRGTLAEQEEIQLYGERAELLKSLEQRGVVSAICSKNEFAAAKAKLEEFGLWESLVFCRIEFVPKGEAVRRLLQDIQLRPENTLFIDDNPLNLAEVEHLNPGVHVVDSNGPHCNLTLQNILAENLHLTKSRLREYRQLEARVADERSTSLTREDFLKSCDIRVCLISRGDNLEFSSRLEELVNRTKQLNFLKTRFNAGSMPYYLSRLLEVECYSVAVWDKFGYHGIVGFAAVERWKHLRHFAFSCRTMHMGIEDWVLAKLLARFEKLNISEIPLQPTISPWIREVIYEGDVRESIRSAELKEFYQPAELRIMASCQSGSIAHYSGLGNIVDFDNSPRQFELCQVLSGSFRKQPFLKHLVYGAFTDYADPYWPRPLTLDIYRKCVDEFCEFIRRQESLMLVVLPPENLADNLFPSEYGMTRARTEMFNRVWEEKRCEESSIFLLRIDEIMTKSEVIDCRHYDVSLIQKIGAGVREWFNGSHAKIAQKDVTRLQ